MCMRMVLIYSCLMELACRPDEESLPERLVGGTGASGAYARMSPAIYPGSGLLART